MFFGDQLITTEAPPKFLSSLNDSFAFCLSNKVLPKKVPRPNLSWDLTLMILTLYMVLPNF